MSLVFTLVALRRNKLTASLTGNLFLFLVAWAGSLDTDQNLWRGHGKVQNRTIQPVFSKLKWLLNPSDDLHPSSATFSRVASGLRTPNFIFGGLLGRAMIDQNSEKREFGGKCNPSKSGTKNSPN